MDRELPSLSIVFPFLQFIIFHICLKIFSLNSVMHADAFRCIKVKGVILWMTTKSLIYIGLDPKKQL